MKKYWLLSDPHIYHEKVKKFCNRPDDFDSRIYKGLSRLGKDDILICLGDIAFGDVEKAHQIFIEPLQCTKILVKGNHDKKSDSWYYDHGWDIVCLTFRNIYFGKNILFSHHPKIWDGHYDYNFHGHFHNLPVANWEPKLTKVMTHRHVLVSIEENGYQPISLNKIVSHLSKEKNENQK